MSIIRTKYSTKHSASLVFSKLSKLFFCWKCFFFYLKWEILNHHNPRSLTRSIIPVRLLAILEKIYKWNSIIFEQIHIFHQYVHLRSINWALLVPKSCTNCIIHGIFVSIVISFTPCNMLLAHYMPIHPDNAETLSFFCFFGHSRNKIVHVIINFIIAL